MIAVYLGPLSSPEYFLDYQDALFELDKEFPNADLEHMTHGEYEKMKKKRKLRDTK